MSTHPETNLSSTSARLCPGLLQVDRRLYVELGMVVELLGEAGIDEPGFWRSLWRRERRASA